MRPSNNNPPPNNPPAQPTYEPVATFTIDEDGKTASIVEHSGIQGGLIAQVPAWDGMIVAGGKLFMTKMKGEVICLSE